MFGFSFMVKKLVLIALARTYILGLYQYYTSDVLTRFAEETHNLVFCVNRDKGARKGKARSHNGEQTSISTEGSCYLRTIVTSDLQAWGSAQKTA